MLKRILTSIIGLPILVALVLLGGIWFQIAVAIVILLALYEFYTAFAPLNPAGVLGLFCAGLIIIDPIDNLAILLMGFTLFVMMLVILLHKKLNVQTIFVSIFGVIYIGFMLTRLLEIRAMDSGVFLIWLVFTSAWGCDTGAYIFGKLFGKRKLIPALSPNKTIAGSIGGAFSAAAISGLYGWIMAALGHMSMDFAFIAAGIGLAGGIMAQFGDLTASAIKRHTGKKDFGNIMPGHGGVLDRFDSIIFTAPLVYIVANFVQFV